MNPSSLAPYMYQPFGAGTRYEEGLPDFGGYFDTLGTNPLGAINPTAPRYEVSMEAIARELDLYPPGTLPPLQEQAWDGPVLPLLPPYRDFNAPAPRTVAEDDQIPPELQQVLDDYARFNHTWTLNFDGMNGVAPCEEQLPQPLPPFLPSAPSLPATGPTYGVATKGRYSGMYVEIPKALPPLGRITRSMAKKDTPEKVQKVHAKVQEKVQEKKKTRSSIQKKAFRRFHQKNQSKDDYIVRCFCEKCHEVIQDTASSRGRHDKYYCPFGEKFVPTCPDCHEPFARLDSVGRHQRDSRSACLETQRTKGLLPSDE